MMTLKSWKQIETNDPIALLPRNPGLGKRKLYVKAAMKEAIRQALEIAAEEAGVTYTPGTPYEDPETGDECAELNISVGKDSILNVIDRVK